MNKLTRWLLTQSASVLSWGEVVAAFGVARKVLSVKASSQGADSKENCAAHAVKRFSQGMSQDIEALVIQLH